MHPKKRLGVPITDDPMKRIRVKDGPPESVGDNLMDTFCRHVLGMTGSQFARTKANLLYRIASEEKLPWLQRLSQLLSDFEYRVVQQSILPTKNFNFAYDKELRHLVVCFQTLESSDHPNPSQQTSQSTPAGTESSSLFEYPDVVAKYQTRSADSEDFSDRPRIPYVSRISPSSIPITSFMKICTSSFDPEHDYSHLSSPSLASFPPQEETKSVALPIPKILPLPTSAALYNLPHPSELDEGIEDGDFINRCFDKQGLENFLKNFGSTSAEDRKTIFPSASTLRSLHRGSAQGESRVSIEAMDSYELMIVLALGIQLQNFHLQLTDRRKQLQEDISIQQSTANIFEKEDNQFVMKLIDNIYKAKSHQCPICAARFASSVKKENHIDSFHASFMAKESYLPGILLFDNPSSWMEDEVIERNQGISDNMQADVGLTEDKQISDIRENQAFENLPITTEFETPEIVAWWKLGFGQEIKKLILDSSPTSEIHSRENKLSNFWKFPLQKCSPNLAPEPKIMPADPKIVQCFHCGDLLEIQWNSVYRILEYKDAILLGIKNGKPYEFAEFDIEMIPSESHSNSGDPFFLAPRGFKVGFEKIRNPSDISKPAKNLQKWTLGAHRACWCAIQSTRDWLERQKIVV
eukprot:GHVP01055493.1.p1 GENE.GHVP01055493.1~~GHVP01055493.1.p1  ORF type:complete len:637 (+),score=130.53 GHVP01055493.1:1078-2988(+)